jgi:hypothetical protein
MKSSTFGSIALGVLVVGSAVFATPANAIDRKVNHAMACVPLSPQTTYADLYYRPVGVKNIRSTTEYVVCNLEVDADSVSNWTATGDATGSVSVTFQTPVAGTPSCEVSVGSNLDGTKATFSGSIPMIAGQVANVDINSIHGDAVTQNFMVNYPVSLYCTLPPESSIIRIRVYENGLIDTDDSTL